MQSTDPTVLQGTGKTWNSRSGRKKRCRSCVISHPLTRSVPSWGSHLPPGPATRRAVMRKRTLGLSWEGAVAGSSVPSLPIPHPPNRRMTLSPSLPLELERGQLPCVMLNTTSQARLSGVFRLPPGQAPAEGPGDSHTSLRTREGGR